MAIKWGFGKKEDKAKAPDEVAGNGAASGQASATSAAITGRKRVIIHGNGFPAQHWVAKFKSEGMEHTWSAEASPEELASTEFEIIIETEWGDPGDPSAHQSPALAEGGAILVPCYAMSPTNMAATLGPMASSAIGYTLFEPKVAETPEAPMIEIARPMQTSDEACDKVMEFLNDVGFQAQIVGDAPGLVFARTLAMLINEAASAMTENIASAEDLDTAMKLGVNYPKGLLEWSDQLGAGLIVEILEGLCSHYEEDRYRPCPLLRHMQIAGKKFYEATNA